MPGAAFHAAPAAAAATQERHAIGFDFGRVLLVAVLVVPLSGLQPPFDVDLLPFDEIFLEALGLFAPQDDPVPLGLLLLLALLVAPRLGGRHVEGGHGRTARGEAELRVTPEIANQNGLVHASHFRAVLSSCDARADSSVHRAYGVLRSRSMFCFASR